MQSIFFFFSVKGKKNIYSKTSISPLNFYPTESEPPPRCSKNTHLRRNTMKKLNVALVGLSFGLEFAAIYCRHPDVEKVFVVDKNPKLLEIAKQRYSIPDNRCFTDLQQVLDIPEIDAVHLVTPPATHAPFSVRVLKAGKHCGCTIPMGMSIEELEDVIRARKESGKNYMFMETTVFQREFLYIQELCQKGEFGRLQYMTCAHYQDMEGWPDYWKGFPPLMHPTHAVAPCLMLAGHLPEKVYARGSGKVRKELAEQYGCPYSFESALITLQDSDITIEMERFLYGVARSYSECFRVYGEQKSFEWQQLADEDPVIYTRTGALEKVDILTDENTQSSRGSQILEERVKIPDYAYLLPKEIADFTTNTVYNNENSHLSFVQGGGHGGSHPHLVHEFVRSILEERPALMDDIKGAYWTGTGICAHQSAMRGGEVINIPRFEKI